MKLRLLLLSLYVCGIGNAFAFDEGNSGFKKEDIEFKIVDLSPAELVEELPATPTPKPIAVVPRGPSAIEQCFATIADFAGQRHAALSASPMTVSGVGLGLSATLVATALWQKHRHRQRSESSLRPRPTASFDEVLLTDTLGSLSHLLDLSWESDRLLLLKPAQFETLTSVDPESGRRYSIAVFTHRVGDHILVDQIQIESALPRFQSELYLVAGNGQIQVRDSTQWAPLTGRSQEAFARALEGVRRIRSDAHRSAADILEQEEFELD